MKENPNFDFKGFVDSLNEGELEKLNELMEEDESMEGRIIEAVELIGMVPKLMNQGGITVKERSRIDKIMKNFTRTKEKLMHEQAWTKVDNDRYSSMQQAYKQLTKLPLTAPESKVPSVRSSIAEISRG